MSSKKAQTGETLTWFVATVIIIILLLFSIIIVSLIAKGNWLGGEGWEGWWKAQEETKRDRIAEQSIMGLLSNETVRQKIIDSAKTGNKSAIENEMKVFLNSINDRSTEGWNMEVYYNDEKRFSVETRDIAGKYNHFDTEFILLDKNDEIKLKFWLEAQR